MAFSRRHLLQLFGTVAVLLPVDTRARAGQGTAAPRASNWQSLFDGQHLGRWKPTEFGGQGEVTVADGTIVLGQGGDLTGITWTGEVPTVDYEIELQAMRVVGGDFFCGLTFPVQSTHCSLIVGGWAGPVVGLSSLDGLDASENDTNTLHRFTSGQWYTVRVRVTPSRIQSWIDDESVVDADTTGRRVSVRAELLDSRPLGIASWRTRAALRHIRLRTLAA
jgi:hypothetical protein